MTLKKKFNQLKMNKLKSINNIRGYKMFFFISLISLFQVSCTSKDDIVGRYENKSNRSVNLILGSDNSYELIYFDKVFNKGSWSFRNKNGYVHVSFSGWRDLPNFNISDCERACVYTVILSGSELVFNPDNYNVNFVKPPLVQGCK